MLVQNTDYSSLDMDGRVHSLLEQMLKLLVEKNIGTVVCQENHGLSNDIVSLSVTPGISTTYYVNTMILQSYHQPKDFGGAEINTTTDTINIPDHGYETGDKILYTLQTLQHLLQQTLFILLLEMIQLL